MDGFLLSVQQSLSHWCSIDLVKLQLPIAEHGSIGVGTVVPSIDTFRNSSTKLLSDDVDLLDVYMLVVYDRLEVDDK